MEIYDKTFDVYLTIIHSLIPISMPTFFSPVKIYEQRAE